MASRIENILTATINGTEYNIPAGSRAEALLLELKALIEAGGGGSGSGATPMTQEQVNDIVSLIDADD